LSRTIERAAFGEIDLEIMTLGTGKPLVYLHSGAGPAYDSPLLAALAGAFRVTAPSLPGFGHSALPDDVKRVDDIAYCLLDLFAAREMKEIALVGISFGAWVAAEIAVRDTSRLKSIALISPVGARFATDPSAREIEDIYMLSEDEALTRAFADARGRKPRIDELTDDDLVVMSRNRIALCQFAWSPYMHNPVLRRWLHRIDKPTRIVWGAQDRLVSEAYKRAWSASLPRAMTTTIADAGHFPEVEQPRALAALIADFAQNSA
jgi:pimeloyl-ACP methyl ester carboxylesterase